MAAHRPAAGGSTLRLARPDDEAVTQLHDVGPKRVIVGLAVHQMDQAWANWRVGARRCSRVSPTVRAALQRCECAAVDLSPNLTLDNVRSEAGKPENNRGTLVRQQQGGVQVAVAPPTREHEPFSRRLAREAQLSRVVHYQHTRRVGPLLP